MKILYLIDKMTQLAGLERILTCKMNYLAEHTEHIIFLSTYDQQNCALSFQLNERITYKPFDAHIPARMGISLIRWIQTYYLARKRFKHKFNDILHQVQPDIIICTGYAYPILDIIINTCNKKDVKTIMESHIKSDTVSMTNYVYNHALTRLFSVWDRHIIRSLRHCTCIVTLTQEDKTFWKHYTERIEVIPNMLTITPQKVVDYQAKRVIAAGRYVRQKGYDLLLEAWRLIGDNLNGWHLYVFGNEDRTPYQQLVDQYNLSNSVHLLPATPNIVEEFSKSSIYVMSSRFEGFPLVLGEAMSCGLPCVSFDCPNGPRDIIKDGEDGIIAENGNVEALSQALIRLMSDNVLRQAMGERASINIMRLNPEIIMERWNDLFSNL